MHNWRNNKGGTSLWTHIIQYVPVEQFIALHYAKFYDCSSYLEKICTHGIFGSAHRINVVTLSELSRLGFRRSGDFVYALRLILNDFEANGNGSTFLDYYDVKERIFVILKTNIIDNQFDRSFDSVTGNVDN